MKKSNAKSRKRARKPLRRHLPMYVRHGGLSGIARKCRRTQKCWRSQVAHIPKQLPEFLLRIFDKEQRENRNAQVGLQLLDDARPYDEGDATDAHIKTQAAFERLCDGTADAEDFNRVGTAINMATVRAWEIDAGLAAMFGCAQAAMNALRKRQERWGKWDILPAERAAVIEALCANEPIVDASSPLQMRRALKVVACALQMKKSSCISTS